ncbi:unnamed protein product [Owenia fusiformis]|uniref:Uncharacterized protein n=1 Tax=Owenia fusiformis TaxID=6347 RepID=A0A8J1Y4B5_OWEFU|nr:unnamed protein product [Owenia fusiformis]
MDSEESILRPDTNEYDYEDTNNVEDDFEGGRDDLGRARNHLDEVEDDIEKVEDSKGQTTDQHCPPLTRRSSDIREPRRRSTDKKKPKRISSDLKEERRFSFSQEYGKPVLSTTDTKVGTKVEISCPHRRKLLGPSTIECIHDGDHVRWDAPIPRCRLQTMEREWESTSPAAPRGGKVGGLSSTITLVIPLSLAAVALVALVTVIGIFMWISKRKITKDRQQRQAEFNEQGMNEQNQDTLKEIITKHEKRAIQNTYQPGLPLKLCSCRGSKNQTAGRSNPAFYPHSKPQRFSGLHINSDTLDHGTDPMSGFINDHRQLPISVISHEKIGKVYGSNKR